MKDMNTAKAIPSGVRSFFIEIGEMSYFAGRFFKEAVKPPFEFRELLRQCYQMGNRSLVLVLVTGFIIGLVLTLQSRPTLIEFGDLIPRAFSHILRSLASLRARLVSGR